MTSDSSSSSQSSDEEQPDSTDQKSNSDVNINSIDTSLDAIENQLSSIALNTPIDEITSPSSDHYHESVSEINTEITIENCRNSIGESSTSKGSGFWRNNLEDEVEGEVDEGLLSPSSSGYAGERGSSGSVGSVTSGSGTDGIREMRDNGLGDDDGVVAVDSTQTEWIRGKRHADEDDTSISWRKRKKHFFILSHSGKPIYSRYGDEHKLAGFSATLQAIISFVENG